MTMHIGYARVSTKEQKLDLQMDALKKAGCEKIFSDVISGATKDRPNLDKMLEQLRAGEGDIDERIKFYFCLRSTKNLEMFF